MLTVVSATTTGVPGVKIDVQLELHCNKRAVIVSTSITPPLLSHVTVPLRLIVGATHVLQLDRVMVPRFVVVAQKARQAVIDDVNAVVSEAVHTKRTK